MQRDSVSRGSFTTTLESYAFPDRESKRDEVFLTGNVVQ
jgi:hypothetical protein